MKIDISSFFVQKLIKEQFPQWTHLAIEPVEHQGHDNRTFRLGDDMLVRLPSAEGYAAQVTKEQTWLPKLAPHLSVQIPQPIAAGTPSDTYPWNWSVYKWIEGTSANSIDIKNINLNALAIALAQFLNELQNITTINAPLGGLHCEEVSLLLSILKELVNNGHTVVIIEHNLDAICSADTIIDFGPEGGSLGGTIVASGSPLNVAENKVSITGQYLKKYLNNNVSYKE